jgi:glycosyltransferase involved in cell wall biosynthesis
MPETACPAVSYLASEYPAVSHTFILREVQAVRRLGVRTVTFSVNRPGNLEVMTGAERKEASATTNLKTFSPAALVRANLAVLAKSAIGWLRMASRAMSLCWTGPKSPLKAAAYFAEAAVLLEGMLKAGSNHVHVHFANPAATVALLAASSGLVTMSLSVHGPDEFSNVERDMLAGKVAASSFVRCISHFCKSQVMRHVPFSVWGKLEVVRCGVDVSKFSPRPDPGNSVPVILCLGRLAPAKAQHLLIEALALLAREGVAFKAVFVGGGPDRASLESLAEKLGLVDSVEFTGPLGQQDVLERYRSADVFALPSFAEGLPVVLMEAMAMKIPCLTTHIAGIPELVKDEVNGLLVPAGDVRSLARSLGRLLKDQNLRAKLGERARKAVLEAYDIGENCRAMAELLARHGGGGRP